ncbi:hypothetical protein D3C78_1563660 [compost metagenome]
MAATVLSFEPSDTAPVFLAELPLEPHAVPTTLINANNTISVKILDDAFFVFMNVNPPSPVVKAILRINSQSSA